MILDDFGEIMFGEIFGIFCFFFVAQFRRKMEDLGVDFCGELVFFTNSGLRATIEFLCSEILTFWDF